MFSIPCAVSFWTTAAIWFPQLLSTELCFHKALSPTPYASITHCTHSQPGDKNQLRVIILSEEFGLLLSQMSSASCLWAESTAILPCSHLVLQNPHIISSASASYLHHHDVANKFYPLPPFQVSLQVCYVAKIPAWLLLAFPFNENHSLTLTLLPSFLPRQTLLLLACDNLVSKFLHSPKSGSICDCFQAWNFSQHLFKLRSLLSMWGIHSLTKGSRHRLSGNCSGVRITFATLHSVPFLLTTKTQFAFLTLWIFNWYNQSNAELCLSDKS